MAASSLSTYLDVTQAAEGSATSSAVDLDDEMITQGAKLLAAIHSGTDLVTELPERTEIDMPHVLALLAKLADTGMVDLDEVDGSFRVHLTDATKNALSIA